MLSLHTQFGCHSLAWARIGSLTGSQGSLELMITIRVLQCHMHTQPRLCTMAHLAPRTGRAPTRFTGRDDGGKALHPKQASFVFFKERYAVGVTSQNFCMLFVR